MTSSPSAASTRCFSCYDTSKKHQRLRVGRESLPFCPPGIGSGKCQCMFLDALVESDNWGPQLGMATTIVAFMAGPRAKYWPFALFWQFCVILLSMVCSSGCRSFVIGSTCLCALLALLSAHVPRTWGLFTVTRPIHNEALISTHMLHVSPVYFSVYSLQFKYFHIRHIHVLRNDACLHLALLCRGRPRCAWRAWRAALIPRLQQFSAEREKHLLYAGT